MEQKASTVLVDIEKRHYNHINCHSVSMDEWCGYSHKKCLFVVIKKLFYSLSLLRKTMVTNLTIDQVITNCRECLTQLNALNHTRSLYCFSLGLHKEHAFTRNKRQSIVTLMNSWVFCMCMSSLYTKHCFHGRDKRRDTFSFHEREREVQLVKSWSKFNIYQKIQLLMEIGMGQRASTNWQVMMWYKNMDRSTSGICK